MVCSCFSEETSVQILSFEARAIDRHIRLLITRILIETHPMRGESLHAFTRFVPCVSQRNATPHTVERLKVYRVVSQCSAM